jgi:hypothetical protein
MTKLVSKFKYSSQFPAVHYRLGLITIPVFLNACYVCDINISGHSG